MLSFHGKPFSPFNKNVKVLTFVSYMCIHVPRCHLKRSVNAIALCVNVASRGRSLPYGEISPSFYIVNVSAAVHDVRQ